MTTIHFQVLGVPIAQPRPRAFAFQGHARIHADRAHAVHAWKGVVKVVARAACSIPLTGPVKVRLEFLLSRPGHLRWKTRPMPRMWCSVKPDADNLAKAVLDAMLGVCFEDDAQVCQLIVEKFIAGGDERPSVTVEVTTLEESNG